MKWHLGMCLCLGFFFATASRGAAARDWTDVSGKDHCEAKLLSVQRDDAGRESAVMLQKADGVRYRIRWDRLSEADREYVREAQRDNTVAEPATVDEIERTFKKQVAANFVSQAREPESPAKPLLTAKLLPRPGPDDGDAPYEELKAPADARTSNTDLVRVCCRDKRVYTGCKGTFHILTTTECRSEESESALVRRPLTFGGTVHFCLWGQDYLDWLSVVSKKQLIEECGCDPAKLENGFSLYHYFKTHCDAAGITAWAISKRPDCWYWNDCCWCDCSCCNCCCFWCCPEPRYSIWYCHDGCWHRYECATLSCPR
jgi:hypothetical protein